MKKLVLVLCALALVCGGASAQKKKAAKKAKATAAATAEPATSGDAAAEGKKWYDAERYDQARKYLKKAADAGDLDSKIRLAAITYNQDMDPASANAVFDAAIAQGSAFAMERKAFCTLQSAWDTKESKIKSIDLMKQSSDLGYGDATAFLFEAYQNGFKTFTDNQTIVEANETLAIEYAKKGVEQGNAECMGYVGLWMYEGSHGYAQDEAAGVAMMEKADAASRRFFTTNCAQPALKLCEYYKSHGQAAKAAPIEALVKKYHTELR